MSIRNSIIGLFLLFLSGCAADVKLGKEFAKQPPSINILLFPANEVYKYNHKGETIAGFDSLTDTQQDSALFFDSKYIHRIDDSLFLDRYVNSFLDELRKLKFRVLLPNDVDSIPKGETQVYALNMAQLQVDEYNYPIEDQAEFYDTTYYKSFELNAVDFSAWYEISKMNTEKPVKTVLYATSTMTDSFEGNFFNDPWSGDVRYRYKSDTITLKDVYDLAKVLGRKHAGYLFDFFLNRYIAYHLPDNQTSWYYFHYDRQHNRLDPVDTERFEVLSTGK